MAAMNRRGFLSSLRDTFKHREIGEPFFFGVQMVINIFGEDELRANLHRIIDDAPVEETPDQKRQYYRRVIALVRDNVPTIEYGYWDYITGADDAAAEFDDWVAGIEEGFAMVEEEVGGESDSERISSEKDYVVVSAMFLPRHTPEHRALEEFLDGVPEDDEYTPLTFQGLVDAMAKIDFEWCDADAMYILPGSDRDGFSWTDMRAEGWEYLKPVMGKL